MTSLSKKKSEAREELVEAVKARASSERVAERKRKALFRTMERARREGMLSYKQIAEIVGVSTVRVAQVLNEVRKANPELSEED